jgi:sec-independent protein translocase protein TatA
MAGLGMQEILIILVVVLVIFGAGKVPQMMKDLGAGVREMRQIQEESEE